MISRRSGTCWLKKCSLSCGVCAALQQSIYQAAWQAGEGSADEAALLEYLAQCEHLRWMAFHLMSGWRLDSHGLPRDQWQRLKVHPNLVPYAELSEDDKEKDRVNIRAALPATFGCLSG